MNPYLPRFNAEIHPGAFGRQCPPSLLDPLFTPPISDRDSSITPPGSVEDQTLSLLPHYLRCCGCFIPQPLWRISPLPLGLHTIAGLFF